MGRQNSVLHEQPVHGINLLKLLYIKLLHIQNKKIANWKKIKRRMVKATLRLVHRMDDQTFQVVFIVVSPCIFL
jgi:hypothetical protein